MTKRREPLTYHRALTTIAARLGWDTCAAICGVTDRTVRYWSDPDCETEIRLIDAERLDRAFMEDGGDHAPFHRLFSLRLEIARREAELHARHLARIASSAAKESGEATGALIEAVQDPSCPVRRRQARKEMEEAIEIYTEGLAALDHLESGGSVQ